MQSMQHIFIDRTWEAIISKSECGWEGNESHRSEEQKKLCWGQINLSKTYCMFLMIGPFWPKVSFWLLCWPAAVNLCTQCPITADRPDSCLLYWITLPWQIMCCKALLDLKNTETTPESLNMCCWVSIHAPLLCNVLFITKAFYILLPWDQGREYGGATRGSARLKETWAPQKLHLRSLGGALKSINQSSLFTKCNHITYDHREMQ